MSVHEIYELTISERVAYFDLIGQDLGKVNLEIWRRRNEAGTLADYIIRASWYEIHGSRRTRKSQRLVGYYGLLAEAIDRVNYIIRCGFEADGIQK